MTRYTRKRLQTDVDKYNQWCAADGTRCLSFAVSRISGLSFCGNYTTLAQHTALYRLSHYKGISA